MAGLNTMATIVLAINLGIWLAILIGIVALQVFLSRRKAWWPGLILPVCTLPGIRLSIAHEREYAVAFALYIG